MPQTERFRYRISFVKNGPLRFTSHLDLHRALERTFRRAGLSMVYSEGYNPRPKIHLSPALPLGFTSSCELVDVWLETPRSSESLLQDLREASPPGLEIQSVHLIDDDEPALQIQVVAACYDIFLEDGLDRDSLQKGAASLLEKDSILRERRGKKYDLRPLIEALEVRSDQEMGCHLRMQLSTREGATGRPEEVLRALGFDPHNARIHRSKLIIDSVQT
jgi:radical SAM-linked protein